MAVSHLVPVADRRERVIPEDILRTLNSGGPGEIRTPDRAASKGVSACKADVLSGTSLTRLNYRPTEKESSGVFG